MQKPVTYKAAGRIVICCRYHLHVSGAGIVIGVDDWHAGNWHLHSCWAVLGLCTLMAYWLEVLSAKVVMTQQTVGSNALPLDPIAGGHNALDAIIRHSH